MLSRECLSDRVDVVLCLLPARVQSHAITFCAFSNAMMIPHRTFSDIAAFKEHPIHNTPVDDFMPHSQHKSMVVFSCQSQWLQRDSMHPSNKNKFQFAEPTNHRLTPIPPRPPLTDSHAANQSIFRILSLLGGEWKSMEWSRTE